MNLQIFTDGPARGNPGPAGIGVVIYDDQGKVLEEHCRYLGTATNNVAEYQALIAALEIAAKYIPCRIELHSDSELMVRQMSGRYKVKNQGLLLFFQTAQEMLRRFQGITFISIPREKNKEADRLANQAIDQAHGSQGALLI